MKDKINGLLTWIAIAAMPVSSLAQMPIATSTGISSVKVTSQCMQSSVTVVNFIFNITTNPATYTFKYTCTLMMNGSPQTVDYVGQDGSGACLPSQSTADCKNAAMGDAENSCSYICASYP